MKKETIWFIIGVVGLVIILIIAMVLLFGNFRENTSDVGLLNPEPLDVTPTQDVESESDRLALQAEKREGEGDDWESLETAMYSYLSGLDYTGLAQWVQNRDWDTGEVGVSIRSDIAKVLGATETNSYSVMTSMQNPEILAAAVASLPIDYKMYAFINVDSLAFPAEDHYISLSKADKTEDELAEKLSEINGDKTSYTAYKEIRCFYLYDYGYPCQLWVVRDGYGWIPYLLELREEEGEDMTTVFEAMEIKQALYKSNSSLEDIFVVQRATDNIQEKAGEDPGLSVI